MEVTIRRPDDSTELNREMNDLLDLLLQAYGEELPDIIDRVSEKYGSYYLHFSTEDLGGNRFGEILAAHGWAVVGFHTYHTEGPGVDTVTVRRIDKCGKDDHPLNNTDDVEGVVFDPVPS